MAGESFKVYLAWRDMTVSYTTQECTKTKGKQVCVSKPHTETQTVSSVFMKQEDLARSDVDFQVSKLGQLWEFSGKTKKYDNLKIELGAMRVFQPLIDAGMFEYYRLHGTLPLRPKC